MVYWPANWLSLSSFTPPDCMHCTYSCRDLELKARAQHHSEEEQKEQTGSWSERSEVKPVWAVMCVSSWWPLDEWPALTTELCWSSHVTSYHAGHWHKDTGSVNIRLDMCQRYRDCNSHIFEQVQRKKYIWTLKSGLKITAPVSQTSLKPNPRLNSKSELFQLK